MTTDEKYALLNSFNEIPILNEEHFAILKTLSEDEDESVRSGVPIHMLDFVNEKGKAVLLKLIHDEDELVRTEAYDSLCAFYYEDVEKALKQAIGSEPDELARSYAIDSWADVIVGLDMVNEENASFLNRLLDSEETERCKLSCCYGLYVFGNKDYLTKMLGFLNSEDYYIRSSVINLMRDLVNNENKDQIAAAVKWLLAKEEAISVRTSAEQFLKELTRNIPFDSGDIRW